MPNASLNISIIEKRMLKLSEAAGYFGLPVKHFKAICPVTPVEFKIGVFRWDKQDLDQWIDNEKSEGVITTREAIIEKL